jgi:pimeloyl-ACP methyl ester carboxylesterase
MKPLHNYQVEEAPMSNYAQFDHPSILSYLFYPRPEDGPSLHDDAIIELSIPVEQNIAIGGKAFIADRKAPSILFFHGNGEIVADYDDLGPLFAGLGINFLPVDYRGYGRSGGSPSVSSMMKDCHVIYDYIARWLADGGYGGRFIIMGRSLGSASALELASSYAGNIDALIIDSGFAYALPLLRLIGADPDRLGLSEEDGFRNADKIRQFSGPTLIIHAEFDHIIPYSDGVTLFEASPSERKKMLAIPRANHNTIFMHGLNEYLNAVKDLAHAL